MPEAMVINEINACKLLEETDHGSIFFIQYKMPLFMRDRYCILHNIEEKIDSNKHFFLTKSIDYEYPALTKNAIKIDLYSALMAEQTDDGLLFTEISNFDLKLSIPISIFNSVLGSIAKKDVAKLVEEL